VSWVDDDVVFFEDHCRASTLDVGVWFDDENERIEAAVSAIETAAPEPA